MSRTAGLSLMTLVGALAGCATAPYVPLLYPNEKVETVGEEAARGEVVECIEFAKRHGVDDSAATTTAEDATAAGAGGAIGGALSGNPLGIITGAVPAIVQVVTRGALAGSQPPNQTFRLFVERCLNERGYAVVDWTRQQIPRSSAEPSLAPEAPKTEIASVPPREPAPEETKTLGEPEPRLAPEAALPAVASREPSGPDTNSRELALEARAAALDAWRSLDRSARGGAPVDIAERAYVWRLLSLSDQHFAEEHFAEARGSWAEASQRAGVILEGIGATEPGSR